jgi:hypothetical protein
MHAYGCKEAQPNLDSAVPVPVLAQSQKQGRTHAYPVANARDRRRRSIARWLRKRGFDPTRRRSPLHRPRLPAAHRPSLVDAKNSKLYLVASDGEGNCLCSRNLSRVFLDKNLSVLMYAIFAAPPVDITTVDMRIPTFGTVRNVPVQ